MDIIANILKINSSINESIQNEIIHILKIALELNYFQLKRKYNKQTVGLAVGVATSAILAESDIQNMEHKQMYTILIEPQIIGYLRYVDSIL
jgi:hypothetical protein